MPNLFRLIPSPRWLWLQLLLIALGFAGSAPITSADEPGATREDLAGSRPNILLIMTDDQGYGPIGRHGHPWIRTPNLDTLHDASTRFSLFLVSPTCSPTRSALMTGRHPMRNGITHTILERERLTLEATTLAEVLGAAGYATGIFGKWHLGDEEPYQPENRGFDEVFIHGAGGIGQAYDCSCADAPNNSYFDPVVRHNGTFVKTRGFCTDVFFQAALGWIDQRRDDDQPFFAYVVTNAPHGPFLAPEANTQRFSELGFEKSQAGFYGMIENIDENIGRLLERFDTWNLFDDTLIIFLSDNGMTGPGAGRLNEPLGIDNGEELFPYNAGMRGLKGSADEGGVRVPFFVRWDGRVAPDIEVDRVAAHIDVFPTLVELAGAAAPDGQVEGRSLLGLVADPQAEWPDRYLFTHRGRWPTGADPDDYQYEDRFFAVRGPQYRLVGRDKLYDMIADPGQTTNVVDRHPEVVRVMLEAYDAWWTETRPLMVNESAPMSPVRPYHEWYRQQEQSTGIPEWDAPEF